MHRAPIKNGFALPDLSVGRGSGVYDRLLPIYDERIGFASFRRARAALRWALPKLERFPCSAADLGCGTGLFVRHLCNLGCKPVFGVDRSRTMLELARDRNRTLDVCLLNGDLRNFRLPHPVDLTTAHADVVNHLLSPYDLRRAFERIRAATRMGGSFLFDVVTHDVPPPRRWTFIRHFPTRRLTLIEVGRWNQKNGTIQVSCYLLSPGRRGVPTAVQTERTYRFAEVLRTLDQTGFRLADLVPVAALSERDEPWPRRIVLARAC